MMIGLSPTDARRLKTHENRAWLARRKRRPLVRRDWIAGVVAQSRELATSLRGCDAASLVQHTDRLRKFSREAGRVDPSQLLCLAGAAVIEAIRQTLRIDLFDVQLHAGVVISCDAVAEMQTGEGKTLSGVLPAYVKALPARGVHVATPNHYLAGRDHEKLAPVFQALGMSTGLLVDNGSPHQSRAAYQADITYGPGHAFGFDYLRDQLTLAGPVAALARPAPLGSGIAARLCGQGPESRLLQRGLFAAIVDEIDHVLIDDAVSPLLLSGHSDEEAADAEIHHAARELARQLIAQTDYHIDARDGGASLTRHGLDRVYQLDSLSMHPQLVRPWHEYVLLALRASLRLQRDVHYVVRDGQVRIVDPSTGRIFDDRTWSDGLQQAVQALEGLTITGEQSPLARITRQRFYRYYRSLGGMTGTATGCEREFASVYGLPVVVIPLRVASQRRRFSDHLSCSRDDKLRAIADEAMRLHQHGRAVLIGTLSIAESRAVAEQLEDRGLPFQLLNGVQDADEASVIARAGRTGAITVATNLAGRGTDIPLDATVARRGGLHVIVTQKHSLARVDRQLIGRSARCGDPGSARVYVSAEDSLVTEHAPWLGRAITRHVGRGNPGELKLDRRLNRVQQDLQRRQSAQRWSLLQNDRENEKLLSKKTSSPHGCWQLS
jgi:preprotein translocase subunit SecA